MSSVRVVLQSDKGISVKARELCYVSRFSYSGQSGVDVMASLEVTESELRVDDAD